LRIVDGSFKWVGKQQISLFLTCNFLSGWLKTHALKERVSGQIQAFSAILAAKGRVQHANRAQQVTRTLNVHLARKDFSPRLFRNIESPTDDHRALRKSHCSISFIRQLLAYYSRLIFSSTGITC